MASVTHPNLAMIFGVESWRDTPMLIFEFLDGGTLADRLKGGPLSWQEAIELGVILADVLDRIHSAGILHRDIKPSNILVCERGGVKDVVKLLDFGLVHVQAIEPAPGSPAVITPLSS